MQIPFSILITLRDIKRVFTTSQSVDNMRIGSMVNSMLWTYCMLHYVDYFTHIRMFIFASEIPFDDMTTFHSCRYEIKILFKVSINSFVQFVLTITTEIKVLPS